MKLENVLVKLEKLLSGWSIYTSDWILVSQYAYKLLGYDVKLRYGHFNILVNRVKVPWIIEEGVEIHPPHNSEYEKQFDRFIEKTGFDFDINLATEREFKAKEGKFELYKLPNDIEIRVQKPTGAIKEFEKLLSLSTKEGFGTERLYKDIFYIKDMIRALSEKKEMHTIRLFKALLKKYLSAEAKLTIKTGVTNNEIKGIIACRGKVKGRAYIVQNTEDLKHISDGDILVTGMTSPTIVILLPKISAIVTDQGGMLCHAAILSRELDVPCIVGTQIATTVIKDGDLIEVDADNGVVRIINK